ncbi:MAG: hypothetical protein RRZ24_03105 [Clostridia bacterium]
MRYQNQNVMIPMTIENVVEVKTYIVHDAPYQVVVYEKDALTPIVFTQNELVDYRIGDGVMTQIFTDKVYHTYDPFLQQTKNALRKTFIMDTYQHYYGREPTEEEFNNALEKLIQKVQLKDLQVRLLMAPEAVFYRINMGRTKPLTIVQQKYIEKMLEQGKTVEEIAEAFQ